MNKENKYKVVNKRGLCQFMIYSKKGQQLNEHEVYMINNHSMEGLLKMDVVKKRSNFELVYNLAGLVSLRDFLINPMNRESFAHILQNVLEILKSLEGSFFSQQRLLIEFEHVMVNPATQKLAFIYVPIQNYDCGCELKKFLLDIIQVGTFAKEEDNNYVKEYIRILNDGINFSVFELEEYIKELISESGYRITKTMSCFKCGTQLRKGSNFCSVCGARVSGHTGDLSGEMIYDPLSESIGGEVKTSDDSHGQRKKELIRREIRNVDTQGLSDQEGTLEKTDNDTMQLGTYEVQNEVERYLIRKKNGEKIEITSKQFRMGRLAKYCNYTVSDNDKISKRHAEIVMEKDGNYIVDLNSTNKTYVDDRVVEHKARIYSGSRIRLANEEFTFYAEKRN